MADRPDLAGESVASAASLTDAGQLAPARCAVLALERLGAVAGATMSLASFSLELGAAAAGRDIVVRVSVDKRTHAIAFLSLEARDGVAVVFTARAVFSLRAAV